MTPLAPRPRVSIIAEIGTSHGGDLGRARELVHAARDAGADYAKFQYVLADEILGPRTGTVSLPGGRTDLWQRFRELEQPPAFYEALMGLCAEAGIEFLCTPFGIESARALHALGQRRFKVASPELNHLPLLTELASLSSELILSSGVSTLADIDEALRLLDATGMPAGNVTLLHCVTAYPAPEEDYNIGLVASLAQILGCRTGVSDHSLDPVLVPGLATLMDARCIEKHIALSHEAGGLDDSFALLPDEFSYMVQTVRRLETVLELNPDDGPAKALEQYRAQYGAARVNRILGDGIKRLAPSERPNYGRSNRSVHARRSLRAGERIAADDLALWRTEHHLRPGAHPRHLSLLTGARLAVDVPEGEGVRLQDVVARGD